MIKSVRFLLIVSLIAGLFLTALPPSARAEESGSISATATIGLLLVVTGVLGWVAWQTDKEDRADGFSSNALLPLYRSHDDATAIGFMLNQKSNPDQDIALTAGFAVGRRF
ncbi:MAG: hypothetical protein M5U15_02700 [Kiritimatiellae bacterium]|nr:hypothetical protein [Kiritimatiellia bacterium]